MELILVASSHLFGYDILKFLSFLAPIKYLPPEPWVMTLKGSVKAFPGSILLSTTAYREMKEKTEEFNRCKGVAWSFVPLGSCKHTVKV